MPIERCIIDEFSSMGGSSVNLAGKGMTIVQFTRREKDGSSGGRGGRMKNYISQNTVIRSRPSQAALELLSCLSRWMDLIDKTGLG